MNQESRMSGPLAVLRAVHDHPGVTRVSLARQLGMPSGFAAETIARLTTQRLVVERPAPPTGSRGRPTTSLHPHPQGPVVAVAAITHETWRVAIVELGGGRVASVEHSHRRDEAEVIGAVAAQLHAAAARFGARIRAVAVAVPGTVVGSRLVHAPNLGWRQVDLSVLWPIYDPDCPLLVGNDATFAGLAESRRGAALGAGTMLHLYMDAGVGGAVIESGRALRGATGMAGEFGHMPFGDEGRRCRCGATGCWNTTLDGLAVAALLHQAAPVDEVTYTRAVIAAAQAGRADELAAIRIVALSLGRGAAGLVNAFDPHIVTLGGLACDLLGGPAGDDLRSAYLRGLMQFRPAPAPRLVAAHFFDDAPLVGAAEDAVAAVLSDEGLRTWSAIGR